jgi:four helix bundle protein
MEHVPSFRDYRDLLAWRRGIDLVKLVYDLTTKFPSHELYGLSSQVRRAAVSVPSNIAEGQSRRHNAEFNQFLSIALGSTAEIDTQLLIAHELEYIAEADYNNARIRIEEIRRLIRGLQAKLTAART